MPYCWKCGSEYQEGSNICQSCGYNLGAASDVHQYTDSSVSKMERWTGEYAYDKSGFIKSLLCQIAGASRYPIAFSADLVFDGNRLSGTMKEVNTFLTVYGEDSPRYLISNISGYIDGNEIIFDKNYDGGGGYGHTVRYKGKFDADGGKIFGAWIYHGEKGNFKMSRISKVLPTSLI